MTREYLEDVGKLLLRMVVAGLMLFHGVEKLLHGPGRVRAGPVHLNPRTFLTRDIAEAFLRAGSSMTVGYLAADLLSALAAERAITPDPLNHEAHGKRERRGHDQRRADPCSERQTRLGAQEGVPDRAGGASVTVRDR